MDDRLMTKYIAERRLLYSTKGSDERREFVIRLGVPYQVKEGMVNFSIEGGVSGCHIELDGIDEEYPEVYGADTLQAINIASNVEPFLKRLQKKYDLFWLSGEPYFDE